MTVHRFETDELDPFRRGEAIGQAFAGEIIANIEGYRNLFRAVRVDAAGLPGLGETALAHIDRWAPDLGAELHGSAKGAGIPLWQIGMLNARTEILATVKAIGEGECSTSVILPAEGGPPRTIQTWDWHDVSNENTLVVRYRSRGGRTVRYFTEFGILGKIGLNDAGIGVHFNILNHAHDGEGIGVPVHAVARAVLDGAGTLGDAIAIAQSAKVSASTVLTIVSYADGKADAAQVELSSGGHATLHAPEDGFLLHTNHFLDRRLAAGELSPSESSTFPRLEHLHARRALLSAVDPVDRVAGLLVHQADGAPICCHPDPALSFENRWQSLITITLDLERSRLEFHEGGPCTVRRESWQVF
jgi:isopenicillin-N N-acyltransferase-like protein